MNAMGRKGGEMVSTQDPPSGKLDDPKERLREHLAARFPNGVPDEQRPVPASSDDPCGEEVDAEDHGKSDSAAPGGRPQREDS
jgi:hypothetical protein